MSGVFGVFDSRHRVNVQVLMGNIGASIRHKEWHIIDSYDNQAGGFGLGRKGIGIFNRGKQPVWNSNKTLAVVMAGELFKKNELVGIDN